MEIALASSSATRATLLRNAGVSLSILRVSVDEDAIRLSLGAENAAPQDVADTIAEFKARRGAAQHSGLPVLGCDQILEIKGNILAKPATRQEAFTQLQTLQGQTHRLLSAAVLYEDNVPTWRVTGQARLTLHALTDDEIDAYLTQAWPDVSGSLGAYHAEGYGARLFSRIDGDWFSVLGLPLLQTLSHFRTRGWLT